MAATGRFMRTASRVLMRRVTSGTATLRRGLRAVIRGVRSRLAAFESAQAAAAHVYALQQQVDRAEERVTAYLERERLLEQELQYAEQSATAIALAARTSAEETVSRARAVADEIIRAAQETATETLREARAAADETLRAARVWAEATLEDARARAQHGVDAIGQEAAGRIEPLKAAADRLASDARRMVQDMETRVQAGAAELAAKIEAFEEERDGYSRGLAALIERHAETLERIADLEADVQGRLIPSLSRLGAGLKISDTSWLPQPSERRGSGRDKKTQGPPMPGRQAPAPAADGDTRRSSSPLSGEVTVRQINSFREASKFMRALAQVRGVEIARLRGYTNGVATIDLTVDGPLDALDLKHLEGFPIEVEKATAHHLVIQIARRPPPFHSS